MGRAPCCDKANVKKGPWSPEEDAKLKAYIDQNGTGGNWIALPQKIGLKRCGKSCRLRWLNYLRPNIKHGGFSEEEDNLICSLYISIGSRWSIIAAQLPGRTDNDIKNYWNTRLKKKLLGRRKQSSVNKNPSGVSNGVEDSSSPSSHALSNSALERLQLHMQLQSLQDPFSMYSNPTLWPKLHPFQEKLLLQSLSESSNNVMNNPALLQNGLPAGASQHGTLEKVRVYDHQLSGAFSADKQDYPKFDNSEVDISENASVDSATNGNNNLMASSSSMLPLMANGILKHCDASSAVAVGVPGFQAELEGFLMNNKVSGFAGQAGEQMIVPEFDCFKQMSDAKESLVWWSNELETKSASSSSWDYDQLGYNM